MYFTYIIQSERTGRYYVGYTKDITLRLERHNLGWSKSTKSSIPWKLVHLEKFDLKSDAIKREHEIKSWKSRKKIEKLIQR